MKTPTPHRRLNTSVSLVEFLRPDVPWPYPYSIEMAFQVLHQLMLSGVGYLEPMPWVTYSVTSLLGGRSADYSHPKPITSLQDLRQRFHTAVFGGHRYAAVNRWRKDKGVNAYATLPMRFYHYKPMAGAPHLGFDSESEIAKSFEELLSEAVGRDTAVSLNWIHHGARTIHAIDVVMSDRGFTVCLRHGFHTPDVMKTLGDSEWSFALASSRADSVDPKELEPFLDTWHRAVQAYRFIMDPRNENLTLARDDRSFVPKSSVNTHLCAEA